MSSKGMFLYYALAICPVFAIASYTDIKRKEIPIRLFPSLLVFHLLLFHDEIGIENWLGLGATALVFLAMAIAGKIGGGDVIMFSVLGFILGLSQFASYMVVLTIVSLIMIPWLLLMNKKKRERTLQGDDRPQERGRPLEAEFPVAPIAGTSFCVWLIFIAFKENIWIHFMNT